MQLIIYFNYLLKFVFSNCSAVLKLKLSMSQYILKMQTEIAQKGIEKSFSVREEYEKFNDIQRANKNLDNLEKNIKNLLECPVCIGK